MDLMKTTNQLSRKKTTTSESSKKTHDIIRSAFESIRFPSEPKRRNLSTAGEEALFYS